MRNPSAVTKSPMKTRDRAVVTVFIGVQLLIPAALLAARTIDEGPHPVSEYRYSWQMYSAASSGDYIGVDAAGAEQELSTTDLPPILRGVGYDYSVPQMLCEANPHLISVQRVTETEGLEAYTEAYAC